MPLPPRRTGHPMDQAVSPYSGGAAGTNRVGVRQFHCPTIAFGTPNVFWASLEPPDDALDVASPAVKNLLLRLADLLVSDLIGELNPGQGHGEHSPREEND